MQSAGRNPDRMPGQWRYSRDCHRMPMNMGMAAVLYYVAEACQVLSFLVVLPALCTAVRQRVQPRRYRGGYRPRHIRPGQVHPHRPASGTVTTSERPFLLRAVTWDAPVRREAERRPRMALRTYRCVLFRQATTAVRGRTVFREVDQFSCELDLVEGMGYTLRAALIGGVRQAGGDEADIGEYRMDVLDAASGEVVLGGWAAFPGADSYQRAGALVDYGDDELISELARRMRGHS